MSSAPAAEGGHVKITQVRSAIGTKPKHRGTLRALGLRGIHKSRILPDGKVTRAMVARVPHLVEVSPASADEVESERARIEAARAAHRRAETRSTR